MQFGMTLNQSLYGISMIDVQKKKHKFNMLNILLNSVKEKDTEMSYIKNTTINNMERKYQRWYDKNETISTAFSYLKGTTKTIQKEVSLSDTSIK